MKILFTVEFYEPMKGGAQEVVKQLAERLARKGNEVTVATTFLPARKERSLNGVKIEEFRISGNSTRGIKARAGETDRYRKFLLGDFDIIVNYAAQIWTTDLAFGILGNIKAKKVLVPCGYLLGNPVYKNYFKSLPEFLKKYDKLVYMSPNYQDKIFGDKSGAGDKALIIPNGASAEEFLAPDNFNIREKLNIRTKFLIIDVSNHYREKGHKFVIESFWKMRRNDSTLLIIGEIPSSGFRKFLHLLIGCYKFCFLASLMNRNIKIASGRDRDMVLSAYKNADLFLFGSRLECAPLVMYESFASKTPFITTDVGNVKDHRDCLKIAGSPEEMAEIANSLLDNEKERDELADRAFDAWRKSHTWEIISGSYELMFKSLIK
jgi:glycosyltransferase involved in cell wall biosynthesis